MDQRDLDDDDRLPVISAQRQDLGRDISQAGATAARTPDSGITRIANGEAFEELRPTRAT